MNNEIKNIGTLSNELLLFGGIYSNLQALQSLKQIAEEQNIPPTNIICTGDIVGYCAQPEECLQLVKDWGIHCIAGNVELNLRDEADDCGCNFNEGSRCDLFSRQWYPYAKSQLSETSLEWIKGLPELLEFSYAGKKVVVLHGSVFNTSEFIFKSTPWSIKQANFEETQADIILAGHCGLPFAEEQAGKLWLNAGVIGMPANDGTPRVWYARMTEHEGVRYAFDSLAYDYEQSSQLMRERPLPTSYAETLVSGIWDNCEILPEEETREQGRELVF